jgi:hypothetical protein
MVGRRAGIRGAPPAAYPAIRFGSDHKRNTIMSMLTYFKRNNGTVFFGLIS